MDPIVAAKHETTRQFIARIDRSLLRTTIKDEGGTSATGLTTKGQPTEFDFQMVEDLGFEIITGDRESHKLWNEWPQVAGELAVAESCRASCST